MRVLHFIGGILTVALVGGGVYLVVSQRSSADVASKLTASNDGSSTVEQTIAGINDLAVRSFTVEPTDIVPDQTITISYSIVNSGSNPVSNVATSVMNNGENIGKLQVNPHELTPGESWKVTATIKAPSTGSGDVELVAYVQPLPGETEVGDNTSEPIALTWNNDSGSATAQPN